LNAVARVELPELAPCGGAVRVPLPEPSPAPPPGGGVTPCCSRQATNVDRALLDPVLADADAALELLEVIEVVVAPLPQAAITQLEIAAARTSEARRARRGVMVVGFIGVSVRGGVWGRADGGDQPPPVELEAAPAVEPAAVPAPPVAAPPLVPAAPAADVPESLTELAVIVPLEFFTPWMTTESPG